ncbi:MAG TPA: phage tail protein [Gemmatimonadaceae bacterium]|jgi:hypothetical protein|nr:phage tail protein [Gemmatimonadaceae bacterium]
MAFWLLLLLFISTTAVSVILTPKPKDAKPAGSGEFNLPTADASRVVPIIYGTVQNSGPNVIWYGDFHVNAIRQSSGGFLGIGAKKVTTGYQYDLGVQMGLCHGIVDKLVGVTVGSKDPGTFSQTTLGDGHTQFFFNAPNLFGGNSQEGGINGDVDFYYGTDSQDSNDYLTTQFAETAPAYRGLCYAVLRRMYLGTTPYVKPWAFILRRCPNTLGVTGGKHEIAADVPNIVFEGVGNGTLDFAAGTDTVDIFIITATPYFDEGTGLRKWTVQGQRFGLQLDNNNSGAGFALEGVEFSSDHVTLTIHPGGTGFASADVFRVEADGGLDANPACVIYDVMTNPRFGVGKPRSRFDIDSFMAVADTLYTEKTGYSGIIDTSANVDSILADINRHYDLVLYTDPQTSLWTLKAIRNDYDVNTLPVFDQSNILETPGFTRPDVPDLINEVKVEYISRADLFTPRVMPAQNLAMFVQQGEVKSTTVQFHGISTAAVAQRLAQRELKAASYPIAQATLKVNREAWKMRLGDPFKFTWAPLGVSNMVMRVVEISYGALDDSNFAVTIKAVEDIFGLGTTAYVRPPANGWSDPAQPPEPVAVQELIEAPYYLVGENRYVLDLASRSNDQQQSAEVWDPDATEYNNLLVPFTPSGTLLEGYPATGPAIDPDGFVLSSNNFDLNTLNSTDSAGVVKGTNLCIIDSEWMSWETVIANGDGTYTIKGIRRSIMDTLPTDHLAGSRVWFQSDGSVVTQIDPLPMDESVTVRNQSTSLLGTLPAGQALTMSLTTDSRAFKPYPPGNVLINGDDAERYRTIPTVDLTLTWAHRNRLWQKTNSSLSAQSDPDDPAGAEGTYTIKGYVGLLGRFFNWLDGPLQSPGTYIIHNDENTTTGRANGYVYVTAEGLSRGIGADQRFWDPSSHRIKEWAVYPVYVGANPDYMPTITIGATTFNATPYGHYAIGIDTTTGTIKTLPYGTMSYPSSTSISPTPASYPPANWIELFTYVYGDTSTIPGGPLATEIGTCSPVDTRPLTTVVNVTGSTGTSQAMTNTAILAAEAESFFPAWFTIQQVGTSFNSAVRTTAPIWPYQALGYGNDYGDNYGTI